MNKWNERCMEAMEKASQVLAEARWYALVAPSEWGTLEAYDDLLKAMEAVALLHRRAMGRDD